MTHLDPDHAEEELADQIDNVVPSRGYQLLPVVGLGGSAGAIPALRTFLASVPADSGLAFVVVLHLSPEHESRLAEVLQEATSMKVLQVSGTVQVEANSVYVIPPGKVLRTLDGQLQLADLPRTQRRHVAVDLFFRTLADTHGPHATAVVFSGMDGDGAQGIKRVKERGGLTIVQDPEEAEHSGMPRSAIATGMVDWVLPAAEIGERLLDYHRLEGQIRLPPEQPPQPVEPQADTAASDEAALRDVLNFLRTRTGRDFTCYKRATILRRIGRRMQVNGVEDLGAYLACLRTRPGEAGALLQDLLISVTNFFRDAACFNALQAHIPSLFHRKTATDVVRVWVVACATGEEAYSVAMMLNEHARTLDAPPQLQVFATDLDEDAIRIAREGAYSPGIEADVSEERLRRFFVKEHAGYRVRRELREMVLFAVHDVLKDSPFSRLQMVSCRNLLIYLSREAQSRALETFHFALQPGGHLFLGSSESVDDGSPLFSVVDKKYRIYRHRAAPRVGLPVPHGPGTLAMNLEARGAPPVPVFAGAAFNPPHAPSLRTGFSSEGRPASWGEMHLRLLDQIAPPSLLVDGEHDILHLSPAAAPFLQYAGGEPSRNLLRVIHPDLRIELRAALLQAAQSNATVDLAPVPIELGGQSVAVSLMVRPVADLGPGMALVLLRTGTPAPPATEGAAESNHGKAVGLPLAQHLDRELERLKAQLRDTVEQYEASTEELKASNEELQAMNEELRSATEELETSREELQSINEELTTVNHELKNNVDELGHSNSDMQNLMDATAIATVFLDRDLRITRFTPSAVTLFNLIASDVGRPLSDLTSQLSYPDLGEDARRVIEQLVPVEREVNELSGSWYLVRARPYRTLDDRIAGVVLTFVDITDRKQGQEALRRSEERFSAIVNQATVGVVQADLSGLISFANRSFCELMGYSGEALQGRSLLELVHPDDRAEAERQVERLVRRGEPFESDRRGLREDGRALWLHESGSVLSDAAGRPNGILLVCTDISERKRAEEALRASEERLRLIIESATEYAIFSIDHQRRVTSWNTGAERLLGYREAEILGHHWSLIFTDEDRAADMPEVEVRRAELNGRASDNRLHCRKDGSTFWASGALMPVHDNHGILMGFVKVLRDQSDDRKAQQALEQSQADLLRALAENQRAREELETADLAKDRFLAVLSHELRNPLASISGAATSLRAPGLAPNDRDRAAQIVERQASMMKVLLDDLLDISRLRLGKLILQRSVIALADVVSSAMEAAQSALEAGHHQVQVNLPEDPVLLDGDPVRLAQVITNLLTNAARYTPSGGHIEVCADVEPGQVHLHVVDDGMGMPAENIESMFEMYHQRPQTEPAGRGGSGMGIGLALARSIAELHSGSIRASSEGPGRGSRFTVTLPLASSGSASSSAHPPRLTPGGAPGARLKVLVADDNVDAAWSMAKLLEVAGYEVATAHDGKQALDMAETGPDVMVLDIGMPGMDGYEVARRVRQMPAGAGMLLVAATGLGRPQDRRGALEAGFDAHLIKPIDTTELVGLIASHARRKRR